MSKKKQREVEKDHLSGGVTLIAPVAQSVRALERITSPPSDTGGVGSIPTRADFSKPLTYAIL